MTTSTPEWNRTLAESVAKMLSHGLDDAEPPTVETLTDGGAQFTLDTPGGVIVLTIESAK